MVYKSNKIYKSTQKVVRGTLKHNVYKQGFTETRAERKREKKWHANYRHEVPKAAKPKSLQQLALSKIPLAQVDEYLYGHLKKPGEKPIKHLRSKLADVKFDKEYSKLQKIIDMKENGIKNSDWKDYYPRELNNRKEKYGDKLQLQKRKSLHKQLKMARTFLQSKRSHHHPKPFLQTFKKKYKRLHKL